MRIPPPPLLLAILMRHTPITVEQHGAQMSSASVASSSCCGLQIPQLPQDTHTCNARTLQVRYLCQPLPENSSRPCKLCVAPLPTRAESCTPKVANLLRNKIQCRQPPHYVTLRAYSSQRLYCFHVHLVSHGRVPTQHYSGPLQIIQLHRTRPRSERSNLPTLLSPPFFFKQSFMPPTSVLIV